MTAPSPFDYLQNVAEDDPCIGKVGNPHQPIDKKDLEQKDIVFNLDTQEIEEPESSE